MISSSSIQARTHARGGVELELVCKVGQMVFLAIKIPDPANFTERVRVPGGKIVH